MNHRSLAFRLTLWYTVLLGATFALVGVGMFYGLQQYLRSGQSDSLRRRSLQVEQILEQSPPGISNEQIAEEINTRVSPEFNNRFVRVTRAPATTIYRSGQPADRSFDPMAVPPIAGAWADPGTLARTVTVPEQQLMVSAKSIEVPSGRYLVELGSSLQPIEALHDRLLAMLGLLLPALVICAAVGGYLLVTWALRPVDRISQTAERISLKDLDARLPVVPSGDALQRLTVSLNHMLTRLHDAVQISRRFLADASHELRTPLTIIKGELQEIAASDVVQGDMRERIGSVLEEVARLEHLVSGLLALSRFDAGEAPLEWSNVDLAALGESTLEQMRLIADDRGVRLACSPLEPAVVRGDRGRLKQVIVNLVDNAIRFTPHGGSVTVSTASDDAYSVLEVRDTGIGIPAAALPQVFERFFRVDEARSREYGGAGLGLSIAKSICSAHGAQIEVESAVGSGSCFRLVFPRPGTATGPRAQRAPRAQSRSADMPLA
jgi:heavy metal sensor kinase